MQSPIPVYCFSKSVASDSEKTIITKSRIFLRPRQKFKFWFLAISHVQVGPQDIHSFISLRYSFFFSNKDYHLLDHVENFLGPIEPHIVVGDGHRLQFHSLDTYNAMITFFQLSVT